MQYAYPNSSFGYYRGNPQYQGYGSGMGPNVSGNNQFAQGQGSPVNAASGWSPTIFYLFVLVVGEMIVFGILSRHV